MPTPVFFHRPNRACADLDPAIFVDAVTTAAQDVARAYCHRCPFQDPCREHAIAHAESGIWGGTNDLERDRIRVARGGQPAGRPVDVVWLRKLQDTAERRIQALRLHRDGLDAGAIAQRFRVDRSVIYADIARARRAETIANYPTVEGRIAAACRGEDVQLEPAERAAALDRLDDGRSVDDIKARLRVSHETVIRRRRDRELVAA